MASRKTKARAQSEADEQRGRGDSFNEHFLCSFPEESFDEGDENVKKNDSLASLKNQFVMCLNACCLLVFQDL